MKREIKFRAWDKLKKRMVEVSSLYWNGNIRFDFKDEKKEYKVGYFGGGQYVSGERNKEDIELMQFTGLLDMNENEIYENDLVSSKSHLPEVMQVEFIEGAFCMTHPTIEDYPIDINHFYPSIGTDLIVIGNIYQNPDLIK